MNVNYTNLTVLIISYYSTQDIKRLVKLIDKKIKILIIDNAQEKNFQKNFVNFKNIKILTPKYNTGQVGGINLGFKKIKTKYLLYMDPDVYFKKNLIKSFLLKANKIKNFLILAPQHEKNTYKKEFFSNKKNETKDLHLMKLVHGHFLFFNMKNVKKVGYYDKNIWMYYDETDYCIRAHKKKQKIYVVPYFKVIHKGGSSINSGKTLDVEAHHKWHFMWSKFYYYKKNYNIFKAFQKTTGDLILFFIKYVIFFFIDKRKKIIYLNGFLGLLSSYLNKKSYKRL
jgi:N-acetylglucosaminyl-diphospho-decaprenol L-rhamnosyltransferase